MAGHTNQVADPAALFNQGFRFREVRDLRGENHFAATAQKVQAHLRLEAFGIGLSDTGQLYLLAVGGGYPSGVVALVPNCKEFGDTEHRVYVAPILPNGFDILTIYSCRVVLRLPTGIIPEKTSFFDGIDCDEISRLYRFDLIVGNGDYSFGVFPGPYPNIYEARHSNHRLTATAA